MRSVSFRAVTLACIVVLAAAAARAGVDIRTASDTNGRVVVELLNSDPPINSPLITFFVAISHSGTYSARFLNGPAPSPSQALAAAAQLDTITISQPVGFRGARVVWLRVRIPSFTPISHVVVDYTPASTVNTAAAADPLVKALVVNTSVFPVEARSASTDPFFSLAAGWAKLTVSERGMYAVTGADLTGAGIDVESIDPSSVRLYTRGGLNQARDMNDASASWRPGGAMREVAVLVEGDGDGTFEPADRVVFYGVGARDWADYYDVASPDSIFHEHTHAKANYYFLAWGGSLPGAPLRMALADATPGATPDVTTYLHREYRERDFFSLFDYRGDGWLWLDSRNNNRYLIGSVDVRNLVASQPQEFRTVALVPYVSGDDFVPADNMGHHAEYLNNRGGVEVTVGEKVWDAQPGDGHYEDGLPVRARGNFLVDGNNEFRLRWLGALNQNVARYFAWYAVRYQRRILATGDAVGFTSPDTTGSVSFRAGGFGLSGTLDAFEVTDPWSPVRLTGGEVTTAGSTRTLRLAAGVAGTRRHFWVAAGPGLKRPGIAPLSTPDLRAAPVGPHMVIVCHRDFRSAAERLRVHRSSRLPLYTNPRVEVVTTEEVFDNFSGGLPDPMAVRNYLKFLYDNYPDADGNPRLGYVLFLGDATEDFQNHASITPDFVPTNLYFTRATPYTYSTDDWFGHLDPEDQTAGGGVLDVAIGRLPAASTAEAQAMVDRVIGYELDSPREPWRGRVILVADDEKSSLSDCETEWTSESEIIARFRAPNFPSIDKIYLIEYAAIGVVKPDARADFLQKWNDGALLINYIGHGSSRQMADEQVFLDSDVSQLVNGLKLPLFMAFSCTIGDFANPAGKSLSEKLLLREGGGVIGTITAARESYPDPNANLCFALFETLIPRHLGATGIPLGVAAMQSKLVAQAGASFTQWQEENSWKYNLLGDPAVTLAFPRREIRFETANEDTMVAGLRRTLRGAVYQGGLVDTSFDGRVAVTVLEPARLVDRTTCANFRYVMAGGPMYQGTADVTAGQFEVNFRVPRYAATGPLAAASAYAENGSVDAGATVDSVLVVAAPSVEDSLALVPVDGAPRVDLGFKSGLVTVKPGDTVRAVVRDGDGINILSTTNEGKQAILIDDLPVPIDVNEFFSFDHGGIDTSGVLLYPLPELSIGRHHLVYKVSDAFGYTTLDTLRFDVTDAADYYAQAVFNYPNPFQDSTQFLFRISDRASIRLDLFTVSGKRVRQIEQVRDGGEVWMEWDGRDGAGGDLANGVYLYVATVDFVGVERPPVVLRGKLSKIR